MTKVSMHHQIYIVKQMNVCGGYNDNRGEQAQTRLYGFSRNLYKTKRIRLTYGVVDESLRNLYNKFRVITKNNCVYKQYL